MKTHLLFLCLLGCTHLLLVLGHPVDQRRDIARLQNVFPGTGKTLDRVVGLGQVADEQHKELSALINDDSEGVRPDINPYGVEDEEVDSNSSSTNGTASTNGTNVTTSQLTTVDIIPTPTSATGSSSTVAKRTTSVPAILPTATVRQTSPGQPTTSSISSASTSVHLATSTPVPVASSTPVTASVPVTTSVLHTRTPSLLPSNKAPTRTSTTTTSTSSTNGAPSSSNTPTTKPKKLNVPLIAGCAAGGGVAAVALLVCCVLIVFSCVRKRNKGTFRRLRKGTTPEREDDCASQLSDEGDDYDKCFRSFIEQHTTYHARRQQRMDLGSRMQKRWYQVEMKDNGQEKKILTIAPVSQHCPLKLHKHQKGLNKLLRVLTEHPYLHSIELVEYLSDHELLVMVQPLMKAGSLKDMIYKDSPLTNWADKYAHRSSGLSPEKIARYGRQILEAVKFLYSKGFPTLGHIQSGNIFVVNDVCHLGGYENTLLGYKTRLFRLCRDELQHFDVILFGHLVFEMAAGYELTHLRPLEAEYKTVDKSVRPILEYIFEEGFPHDVNAISLHDFFCESLIELSEFDSSQIQLSDSMNKVLEKVRKGKIRVQKSTKHKEGTETLAAKFKTTFRGIVPKFGRGGEEGDLEEKRQKKLKVKSSKDIIDRGGEDSEGDLEEKALLDDTD